MPSWTVPSRITWRIDGAELLVDLIAEVKRQGADLGIGFDGDADRIGAVDSTGASCSATSCSGVVRAGRAAARAGAEIIFDVKCSQGLIEDIAAHGRPAVDVEDGPLAAQEPPQGDRRSAGGRDVGTHVLRRRATSATTTRCSPPDGLLRYVVSTGKTFDELVDSIPHYFSTPEIRLDCPEDRKFAVVEELKRRVHRPLQGDRHRRRRAFEFGDGWGLAARSNTQR